MEPWEGQASGRVPRSSQLSTHLHLLVLTEWPNPQHARIPRAAFLRGGLPRIPRLGASGGNAGRFPKKISFIESCIRSETVGPRNPPMTRYSCMKPASRWRLSGRQKEERESRPRHGRGERSAQRGHPHLPCLCPVQSSQARFVSLVGTAKYGSMKQKLDDFDSFSPGLLPSTMVRPHTHTQKKKDPDPPH